MKKLFLLLTLLFLSQPSFSQSLRIITYNIRYDNAGDGVNQWGNRKTKVADLIKKYNPDIFGVQEGLHHMLVDLKTLLPEYNYVGVGRDDGKTSGEYSAIFYKKDVFKAEQDSTFWLSETPTIIASKSWDAAITRICTWAKFKHKKSHKEFYLFNTHFDHIGDTARAMSADLIKIYARRIAGNKPLILLGDFNSEPSESAYKTLTNNKIIELKDSYFSAGNNAADSICTFTGFAINSGICKRIDYILTGTDWVVKYYNLIKDNDGTYYYSDHLPVLTEISFKE